MSHLASLIGGAGASFKAMGAVAIAATLAYFRGLPEALQDAAFGALILILADTLLGVMRAWQEHKFNLHAARAVFRKIVLYVAVVVAAAGVDRVFREPAFVQTVIVLMIVLTEILSVMEHSEALGFRWPAVIRQRVERLRREICEQGKNPVGDDGKVSSKEDPDGGVG